MEQKRVIKKITACLLAVALTAFGLVGCSAKIRVQEASAIAITDATGRQVTLEKPAEKIVSGYYITTSMLIALGIQDKVVGIEAKADKRPLYKMAAPEFLQLPSVGTAKDFDLEGCALLKPDLVILPKKLSEQADALERLGITAMVVNPESEKELEETILNIAKATGTEGQADKLISYYDKQKKALKKITEDGAAQGKEAPSVYMAGVSGILRTAGHDMYQNDLIELSGGRNAASDITENGWTNISYETLLNYNPDMIVIIPEAGYSKADVLADKQLENLKAVKEGKVYEMPSDFEAWDSPVTSGILGSMWLSSVINEEIYSFESFKEDAASFYLEYYDCIIDKELITK